MHYWNGGGFMGFMWIWWILLIVIVVLGIRFFTGRGGAQAGRRESPEEILKRRYANGEIDREEYERMMSDLRR